MIIDVAKVIRVLGYIVYTALWSPVIVLLLLVLPVVWLVMFMKAGMTMKEAVKLYGLALNASIQHDVNFIKTGIW